MKYYVIKEIDYERHVSKPLCVIEKEEIAIDFVRRYTGLACFEYDTEENKDE